MTLRAFIVAFIADAEDRYGPVWDDADEAINVVAAFIDDNPHVLSMDVGIAVDFWYMEQI